MDLADFDLDKIVAVLSAIIAVASFGFNWAVVQRQTAMQAEGLRAQMDSGMMDWANEAIGALAEAGALAENRGVSGGETELRRERAALLSKLSAIADRGRLFFPNYAHKHHGQDKEGAFRGFRPPVLDSVIFAYQMLERMDARNLGPDTETSQFMRDCRRALVSEVQRAVDPRRRGRMMRKLAGAGGAADSEGLKAARDLAQRLEARHPGVMSVSRDDAWVKDMAKRAKQS